MPNGSPTISVVTATYNRSRVLMHAVHSVLASTFTDWELIVVGDACTDDTEARVASFGDARIRFVNLSRNVGDQSGPNNHGLSLARGRYVAFLNHDDLYLPDHLATCAAALDAGDADLVWGPTSVARGTAPPEAPGPWRWHFHLEGVPAGGRYTPFAFYSASSWVLRRPLVTTVGPWPSPETVYVTPSQEWLFRAWRAGARMKFLRHVSVVVLWSGERRGSYADRGCPEHDALVQSLSADPRFHERMLEDTAINAAADLSYNVFHAPRKALARALAQPAYALLTAAGVHPSSLNMALKFRGPGGYIRHHRRFVGLDSSPAMPGRGPGHPERRDDG
jgi:glycosyltransferase involved in cell wall biosynthesis